MSTQTQGTDTGAVFALISGICFVLLAALAGFLLIPLVVVFSSPFSIAGIASLLLILGTGSVGVFLIVVGVRGLRG